MEFRWAAAIALWTILSGPVFVQVRTIGKSNQPPTISKSAGPSPTLGHLDASAKGR